MENIKNKKGKKKRMIILFCVLGIVIIFIAGILITGIHANTPTKGKNIEQYYEPKSALLVLDVQKGITNNSAYSNTSEFVESVNEAIAYAEGSGMEILYVKNVYGNNPFFTILTGGKGKEGSEDVEFDSRLNVVNNNIFVKSMGDSFSCDTFENYLIANKIDTLYITGADAAGCVFRTAQGGKNREYNVTIISDAVITMVDAGKMKQVEEQYV